MGIHLSREFALIVALFVFCVKIIDDSIVIVIVSREI